MSFNKMILVGNLGKDPELTYSPQGTAVCNFSMATNDRERGRDGEMHDVTEWFDVTVFGKQAEIASRYLAKGKQVYVEGRFKSEKWEDREGKTRVTNKIKVSDLRLIDRSEGAPRAAAAAAGAGSTSAQPAGGEGGDVEDSEYPLLVATRFAAPPITEVGGAHTPGRRRLDISRGRFSLSTFSLNGLALSGGGRRPVATRGGATTAAKFFLRRPPHARGRRGRERVARARSEALETEVTTMKEIKIYCDGSSRGNGTEVMRAGAAAILICGERMRAVGSYLGHMTNQQAEIVAACVGLEALRSPCAVILHSDSKYVVETMNGGFGRHTNLDYWARLDLASSTHAVTWRWVKGNSGDRYQEGCDKLAKAISGMGEVSDTVLVEAVNRLQGRETPALVRAAIDGLRYLSGACDGARKRDAVGFNSFDAELGHRLARKEELRPGELSAARKILRKYFGQLQEYDPSLIALI